MIANMSKSVDINVFGRTYKCSFPKVGELIDIQTLKAKLTENTYNSLLNYGRDGMYSSVFVDTIATFNILLPQLNKDLLVPGLAHLEVDKLIELSYAYKDQYLPFHEAWMDLLTNPKKDEPEASKEAVNAQ